MKSRELLSIVLSLIMVFGVSAGSAYAQTDNEIELEESIEVTANENLAETEDEQGDTRDEDTDDTRDEDTDDTRDDKPDLDDRLDGFCDMTDEEKRQFFADHPRLEQFADRLANYCELSEDERETTIDDFIKEHKDEYKSQMKDKMRDGMTDKKHMDYDRLCALSESDRALEFDDSEKLERISEWCNMTPEEREEYKKEKHDIMKEKRQEALTRIQENPNIPQRIKEMITDKRAIVDDRLDEIRMKYEEKYGDLDAKKSELKLKFKNHMAKMKIQISDERKSAIHDRVAEMKAFKMELRERSSELTDEEKQGLRAEFIETAKDIRLAWVSPHQQMNAGIDSAEIECREGFSHVMKESNGKAMCLKADTALEMIERGIAVPAI